MSLPFLPKGGLKRSPPGSPKPPRDPPTASKKDQIEEEKQAQLPPITDPTSGALIQSKMELKELEAEREQMEVLLKRERQYASSAFTTLAKNCQKLLSALEKDKSKGPSNALAQYKKVQEKFTDLEGFNRKLLEVVLDEDVDNVIDYMTEKYDRMAQLDEHLSLLNLPEVPSGLVPQAQGQPQVAEKAILQSAGINFKVTDHVTPFDGKDAKEYKTFKSQWAYVEKQMEALNHSPCHMFQQLLRVLEKEPRKLVCQLESVDESYEAAWKTLDHRFGNIQLAHQIILDELARIPMMHSHSRAAVNEMYTTLQNSLHGIHGLHL